MKNLHPLFLPKSITLIGASNQPMKWGFIVPANILSGGYVGNLYPINPHEKEILSLKVYPDISSVDDEIDLAIVTVPCRKVPKVLEKCVRKRVKSCIVISSGFAETGEEGQILEKQVADIAAKGDMQLVGPNTMGIFSKDPSLCALMPPVRPAKGGVSFVAQSGNLGTQILGLGQLQGVGFNKFVSSGNEALLKAEDYIEYFGRDQETTVILAYVEGLRRGRSFLDIARKISRRKPIIFLKGGKTKAGGMAAASHCGAMAGLREIYQTVLRQTGVIEVQRTTELLDLAKAFATLPLPEGRRIGILTWGGGWGVVTADCCEDAGLQVPALGEKLVQALDGILPPYWSKGNPVDLVGSLDRNSHLMCLEKLVASNRIDGVIALGVVGAMEMFLSLQDSSSHLLHGFADITRMMEAADREFEKNIQRLIQRHGKPIIGVSMIETRSKPAMNQGITTFPTPERAVTVLSRMYDYYKFRSSSPGKRSGEETGECW